MATSSPQQHHMRPALPPARNELMAVTVLHEGRLHLRIDPRRDGSPWLADAASLASSLTQAKQRLASY